MSATIRMKGPDGPLFTVENGVWTGEDELIVRVLNTEMRVWKFRRPHVYDLEQDKTDALHMIEEFGGGHAELVEFIPPSTEGHPPDTVY
jgi:hypothetical protein